MIPYDKTNGLLIRWFYHTIQIKKQFKQFNLYSISTVRDFNKRPAVSVSVARERIRK